MSYFFKMGNTYHVASEEAISIEGKLPAGNYTVKYNEMRDEYYLEQIDPFKAVAKLYGNTEKQSQRIFDTFLTRPNSTGVMLTGEKGSGKTLLARTIAIRAFEQDMPTIVINTPFFGDTFNKFIQDIEQPAVILFDEFEKVYNKDAQPHALTLLDGVYPSKKLFVITCNDKWRIDENMRNRPGRIFYAIDFTGLKEDFIREYCEENLKEKKHIDKICQITTIFDQFNFDMLKALVEEMNRYGESPSEAMTMLNTKPEYNGKATFDIKIFIDGHECTAYPERLTINPLIDPINGESYGRKNAKDEEEDSKFRGGIHLNPSHIVKIDAAAGAFVYLKDNVRVVALRERFSAYAF